VDEKTVVSDHTGIAIIVAGEVRIDLAKSPTEIEARLVVAIGTVATDQSHLIEDEKDQKNDLDANEIKNGI
jgi:hypothetical protein